VSEAGEDKKSQLLAEIEAFSRQGPVVAPAAPTPPELHRETLSFPDLNKAPSGPRATPQLASKTAPPTTSTPSPAKPATDNASLLARLKQQAQSLQQGSNARDQELEARAAHLSQSLAAAYHYLDDLIKQLNIIKPAIPKEFSFPGNIVFRDLQWTEGAADFRMVPSATEDRRYDNLTARFRLAAPQQITLERDAIGIEPLRKLLHDHNIAFTLEEKKNARSQVELGRFSIPCEIKAGFLIKADYTAGCLILRTRNIERFGMMEFRLQAEELHQETLDELTKLFLGEKSRFMAMFRRSA
jgi:hypothetical protein